MHREIDIVTDGQLSFLFQPSLFYLNNEMNNFRNAGKETKVTYIRKQVLFFLGKKIQRNIYILND